MVKTCSKVMIWHVIQVVKCIFLIRIKTEFFFLENAKGLRFIRFKEFYKKKRRSTRVGNYKTTKRTSFPHSKTRTPMSRSRLLTH
jgi:hypothetical protein